MNLGGAMETLGLIGTALDEMDVAAVRRAFTIGVKLAHPDTAQEYANQQHAIKAVGEEVVMRSMAELKQARDLLINHLEGRKPRCKMCGGSGKQRSRFGSSDCTSCKGTGEQL